MVSRDGPQPGEPTTAELIRAWEEAPLGQFAEHDAVKRLLASRYGLDAESPELADDALDAYIGQLREQAADLRDRACRPTAHERPTLRVIHGGKL